MTQRRLPPSPIVTLGLIQSRCSRDPAANFAGTVERITAAARCGAQIICTQELFRSQYFCQSEDHANFALAEDIPDGPSTQAFCELARARGVVIVASLFERRTAARSRAVSSRNWKGLVM